VSDGRIFCYRIDVDTHLGVGPGMSNLLDLAREEKDVRFTFFVNMGRAVSRRQSLQELIVRVEAQESAPKFSPRYKLGLRGFLEAAILNPLVGAGHPEQIQTAAREGHEIGLHGGANHAVWHRKAHQWVEERTRIELEWGLAQLRDIGIECPSGFASPGWNTPPNAMRLLAEYGFSYLADAHGPELHSIDIDPATGLRCVPTNLLGEPNGVGYLECLRASGFDDSMILDRFRRDLEDRQLAIVYCHPVYLGRFELETARQMFRIASDMGFQIATLSEAAESLAPCSKR
jgi:peptidoglycan/xylan/chitin deacetylase (PgdA/CDA1 family)